MKPIFVENLNDANWLKKRHKSKNVFIKVLGTPIGAKPSDELVDGDGDGFIASTPGGVDDTRVSPKQEKRPKGEITKGNIDLNNRPVVKNRDGSISTVRSITVTEGNTAVVIPTVIKKPNGSGAIVSDQEAIKYYQRSGQHLGKFSNIRDADTYAQNLHNQQAVQYPNSGKSLGTPIGAKPSDDFVDGDGDGLSTGGIVGGEDKIPVVPKTVKKVFGFIGKLKHKLGADGSIHPLALNREIWDELESVMEDKYAAAEFAKKMVAKNLALAMSDVTAAEIADTILDLMPDKKEYDDGEIEGLRHTVKEQMNLVKKISNSSEPLPFVVTDKGDIIPDAFSPAQENAWVDEQFEKYKDTFGDLNFMMGNGQTTEQYERKKLRERYQYLLTKSAQYTHPSPESEQALKEAGLRVLVGSWAISSNDSNPLSLAIQDVAQKMFKIDWAVGWNNNKAVQNLDPSTEFADNEVLKSFVKAQYDATQKYLASKGIKKVTLYRGMQDIITEDYGDGSEVETVEVLLRPLSAWSTDVKEAETFAGSAYGRDGVVIKATIPAQDIFSIPLTGVGCLRENEVVLKSGAVDGILREPIRYPITDEKKKEFQQWAYGEQTGEPPAWFIQLLKEQR